MYFPAFRRVTASLVAIGAALSLSACSLIDVFGPNPDSDLLELANKATSDAQAQDTPVSEVRARHADELYAEIARLCGLDEAGQVPDSCAVEETSGEEAPSPTRLGAYLTAADEVPTESRDLVVSQAVELAAFDTTELEPSTITEPADVELLIELLEREHAAVFALEAARAFASDPASVDAMVEQHQAAVNLLTNTLADAPVSAAGYTFGDVELGDEFITDVNNSLAQAWLAAATDAESIEARAFLVDGAGRLPQV